MSFDNKQDDIRYLEMEYRPFPMAIFARENDQQLDGISGYPGFPIFEGNIDTHIMMISIHLSICLMCMS